MNGAEHQVIVSGFWIIQSIELHELQQGIRGT